MKKTQKPEASHTTAKVVGGIAALAAAAAGAYFLYGSPEAAVNRRNLKSWALRLKAEIMDEMENMKDVSQETYDTTIDKISTKYAAMKIIDQKELADTVKRLKSHWKDIKKELENMAK